MLERILSGIIAWWIRIKREGERRREGWRGRKREGEEERGLEREKERGSGKEVEATML